MKGLDVYRRCLALMGYTAEDDEVLTEKSLVTRMPELINFIADEIGVPAIEKLSDEIEGTSAQREAIIAGSAMLFALSEGDNGKNQLFAGIYNAKRAKLKACSGKIEDRLPSATGGI